MASLRKIVFLVAMFVVMVGIVGSVNSAEASKIQDIQERGYLLVGTTGDYKPMSYLNKETGEYEGFDAEAATLLANSPGVALVFVPSTGSNFTAHPRFAERLVGHKCYEYCSCR